MIGATPNDRASWHVVVQTPLSAGISQRGQLIISFFGHTLPTTSARWPIRAGKMLVYFEKMGKLALELSQTLMTSSKNPLISTNYDVTQKCSHPKVPRLKKMEARRLSTSLEGLNSSLALSTGKL